MKSAPCTSLYHKLISSKVFLVLFERKFWFWYRSFSFKTFISIASKVFLCRLWKKNFDIGLGHFRSRKFLSFLLSFHFCSSCIYQTIIDIYHSFPCNEMLKIPKELMSHRIYKIKNVRYMKVTNLVTFWFWLVHRTETYFTCN